VYQGIKKPRLGLGFPDGAKRTRTADPLHAMQISLLLRSIATACKICWGHWFLALPGPMLAASYGYLGVNPPSISPGLGGFS